MTREEHEARAMLMGMWYDDTDHTYNRDNDPLPGRLPGVISYCADTLVAIEVLALAEERPMKSMLADRRARVLNRSLGLWRHTK